jgi:hypothetical protein
MFHFYVDLCGMYESKPHSKKYHAGSKALRKLFESLNGLNPNI